MERSVEVAAPVDVAFDRVLGDDLTGFFDRGHRLLPAIDDTVTLSGPDRWGTEVGQSRRIVLADGGSMVETVRTVDAPGAIEYVMSDLTGPFAALFSGVLGTWTFEPTAGGTRVTWRWRLRPRTPAGRLATPIIARMWQGYAAKALDRIRAALGGHDHDRVRAITQHRFGSPSELRVGTVPAPSLADGRVLVRVAAVGLNPLDWHEVRGDPWMLRLQRGVRFGDGRVVGGDLAGTVVAVAPDVTSLAVGDRVVGTAQGALAEVALANPANLARLPEAVSSEQAAALPVAGVTALQALRDAGRLDPGDRVLVWAASGGVGHLAVQIARILGAGTIDAVASPARAPMLRDLGVDAVHDRDGAAPTGPYDVVIDGVATASVSTLRDMLAPGARVVTVGGLGGGPVLGPFASIVRRRVAGAMRRVDARGMLARIRAEDLALLADWTASGRLRPVLQDVVAFDEAPAALALLEEGHVAGKLVVRVADA